MITLMMTEIVWVATALLVIFVLYHLSDMYFNSLAQCCAKILKIDYEQQHDESENSDRREPDISDEDLHKMYRAYLRDKGISSDEEENENEPLTLRIGAKQRWKLIIEKMVAILKFKSELQATKLRDEAVEKYLCYKKRPFTTSSEDEDGSQRIPSAEILGSIDDEENFPNPEGGNFLTPQGNEVKKMVSFNERSDSIGDDEGLDFKNGQFSSSRMPLSSFGLRKLSSNPKQLNNLDYLGKFQMTQITIYLKRTLCR